MNRLRRALVTGCAVLSLLLALGVLGLWLAPFSSGSSPLWLHFGKSQTRFALGSVDGQMQLQLVRADSRPVCGPVCRDRAAASQWEQQFPATVRHEYLGCGFGHGPVIDSNQNDELVKTGMSWILMLPHPLAAGLLAILPAWVVLRHSRRHSTNTVTPAPT